jgi:RNase P/RNase MRP subunit p30
MNFNIIKISNVNELNKLIKKDFFNIIFGRDPDFNRKVLENKNINLLLDPENLEEDFMHSKNSGLNQVLVKIARNNNISIGFSVNRILNLDDNKKINLFGKIIQNIMLCNKYKVKYYIVNFINNKFDERNTKDLNDLGLILGIKPNKFEVLNIKNEA